MSKEIKDLLKEAKEAVKKKDYKTSLKLCKNVLRIDKNNYVGLVLLGISMQDKPDAILAFKKAAQIEPKQTLAWQGLASFYEKCDRSEKDNLIEIYKQLLDLESDVKKYRDICEKLTTLALEDHSKIEPTIKILSTEVEKPDKSNEMCNAISIHLVKLLDQYTTLPSEFCLIFEKSLRSMVKTKATITLDYYKKYLRILYRLQKYDILIEEAIVMHSIYTMDISSIEWICKIYTETEIQNQPIEVENITQYINQLLEANSNSTLALLAKAVISYNDRKFIDCRGVLNNIRKLQPNPSLHVWILLTKCTHKLYCYSESEKSAEAALKLMTSSKYTSLAKNMKILLCDSQSRQEVEAKLINVLQICENLDEVDFNFLISKARALTYLKEYGKAEEILNQASSLKPNDINIFVIKFLIAKHQNRINDALEVLESCPNVSESLDLVLEAAMLYNEQNNVSKSFALLLEAAKIDQDSYAAFLYLGQYYEQINNLDKARRCYQRAFKLNPMCTKAGISLSNIYREQKNWVANLQLLESVTIEGIDTNSKWAWLQLGLHHLEQKNFKEAVDTLRSVIRADQNDSHAWEALADAYIARGALTSALKSYNKACELNLTGLYPRLQIAKIKQSLGEFADAKTQYLEILKSNSNYMPALKGLAETCLSLAESRFQQQLLGCARDNAQLGIDMITIALKERSNFSCMWKILADCCNLVALLPEKYCYAYVASSLALNQSVNELTLINRYELFNLATRSYTRALHLADSEVLLWYDIASNYYKQSKYTSDSKEKTDLQQKALRISKQCVVSNSQLWQAWNLLGIVATEMNLLTLAQHAFIKGVLLDNNNACVWTNLGALYIKLQDFKLANEAFTCAQRSQPYYIQCWIGQALIAESLHYEEAMDLFRHCAQQDPHQDQGAIGYASWVCATLQKHGKEGNNLYSIQNMNAIPVASDCVQWYAEKKMDDPCAWNILGILKQRQHLYQSAADAFSKALLVADSIEHKNYILTNLGRVFISLKQYENAVSCFQKITEANFNSSCGLALAYYKAEIYDESYSTYETALEWLAPDDCKKSHILVAMASIAYMFHGPEDAKTLLFQCLQLKPPSVAGLFAACALGLLHGDLQLAQLVLKELEEFSNHKLHLWDIINLKLMSLLIQEQYQKAKSFLCHEAHKYPNEGRIWLALSQLLLKLKATPRAVSNCALSTIRCGRSFEDITKVLGLISLAEVLDGRLKSALKIAQKSIHSCPTAYEGWALLITALFPICEELKSREKTEWLQQVMSYVQKTESNRSMMQWFSNNEQKINFMVEQF